MKQEELVLKLKMVSDIKDAKTNFDNIQTLLSKIGNKMPINQFTKLQKIFSDFGNEYKKYTDLVNRPNKSTNSIKQLENSGSKLLEYTRELGRELGKIDAYELDIAPDATKIKALTDQITEVQNKIQTLTRKDFDSFIDKIDALGSKSKILGSLKDALKLGDLSQINEAFKQLDANSGKFKDTNKIEKLVKEWNEWTIATKGTSTELGRALNRLQELDTQLEHESIANQEALSKSLTEVSHSFVDEESDIRKATQAIIEQDSAAAKASLSVERFKDRILYLVSAANALNLVRRAFNDTYRAVKELDDVMTEMAVVTTKSVGDYWKELPDYTQRAYALGAAIKDVYESMTLYYQQGLNTQQATALSNATMKMARIAGLQAADATDRMTAAMRGFNMELDQVHAENVADVYSALAATSAADVDEISTAMTKVASIAHSANMEFETTSALLTAIIETTRESAETAGTALKTVIARFSEVKSLYSTGELVGNDEEGEEIDVNKISKALRVAGINLNEYLTGAKGLDDIFLELSSKWDNLDRVTQRYIATMAAGSRQQSRFIAMMQNYSRNMELVSTAENAAGASTEQFNKTLESLDAKLNQLKTQWQSFTTTIFNSNLIKGGVDALTNLLKVINKLTGNSGIAKIGVGVGIFAALRKGVAQLNPLMQRLSLHYKDIATISAKKFNLVDIAKQEEVNAALNREAALRTNIKKVLIDTFTNQQAANNLTNAATSSLTKRQEGFIKILALQKDSLAIQKISGQITDDEVKQQELINIAKRTDLDQSSKILMMEMAACTTKEEQAALETIINAKGVLGYIQKTAALVVEKLITNEKRKQAALDAIAALTWGKLLLILAGAAAAIAAISIVGKAIYDNTLPGINKRWEEHNNKLTEANDEVNRLNDELTTTQEKIKALTDKKNSIGLTLEESAELANLRTQEISLRGKLTVAEEEQTKAKETLQQDSLDWLNKQNWNPIDVAQYSVDTNTNTEYVSGWETILPSKEQLAEAWEKFAVLNEEQQKQYIADNQEFIKQSLSEGIIDYNEAYSYLTGQDLEKLLPTLDTINDHTTLQTIADQLGTTLPRLLEYKKLLQESAEITSKGDSILTLTKNFQLLEDATDEVNQVFEDLNEHQYVTTDTIAKLQEKFGKVENFKEYAKRLSDVSASYEEHKQALDELYTAYLDQNEVLSNLSWEDRELATKELERLNIENAEEVVLYRLIAKEFDLLAVNKNLLDENGKLSQSALDLIDKWTSEGYAAEDLNAKIVSLIWANFDLENASYEQINGIIDTISAYATEGSAAARLIGILQKLSAARKDLYDLQQRQDAGEIIDPRAWRAVYDNIQTYQGLANNISAELTNIAHTGPGIHVGNGGGSSSSSSGGGNSSQADQWENDYDRLYNLLERIEDEQRVLNHLQEEYNDLLKEPDAHKALVQNLKNQEASLQRLREYYEELQKFRTLELENAKQRYANLSKYIQVVQVGDNQLVHIDWENIDAIDNSDLYDQVKDAEDEYNRIIDSLNEANDKLDTVDDDLIKLRESWRKDIIDFKNRIKEALIKRAQDQIDALENTNKAIDDANKALIDNINSQISEARTQREREQQEQDLADQRRRLAYLMQDTTGANQLEILKLQKEIAEGEQDYTDQLIDDKINELEKQNDEAAAAREKQIEIMQDQLDWFSANGGFWEQVGNLIGNGDDLLPDKEALFDLFKNFDNFKGMSEEEQEQFEEELLHDIENVSAELGAYGDEIPNPDVETAVNEAGNSYLEGGNESSGATTGNGYTPGHLTDQIAKDVAQTVAAGSWPDYNGWSVWPERERRMNEKFGPGAYDIIQRYIDDIILRGAHYSNNTHATYSSFKTGGLADFTGPAWLDGSKAHPEIVLSAKDSENFIQLRDILSHMYANGTGGTNQTFGDAYYTFQIQVDQLSSDYDVDQIIDRIQKRIEDSSRYRNVNAVNLIR